MIAQNVTFNFLGLRREDPRAPVVKKAAKAGIPAIARAHTPSKQGHQQTLFG
jgi:ABC-type sugar transport system substrate-binding protein